MQIDLTGHHLDITPAMRDYVKGKFERLERHFEHVIDVHVVLSVEKQRHQAEAALRMSGGKIHATAEQGDMYVAIDDLVDKLDRQLVKHKEKSKDHRRNETIDSAEVL